MKIELVFRQFFDSEEHDSFAVTTDNVAVGWKYSHDWVDFFFVDPEQLLISLLVPHHQTIFFKPNQVYWVRDLAEPHHKLLLIIVGDNLLLISFK